MNEFRESLLIVSLGSVGFLLLLFMPLWAHKLALLRLSIKRSMETRSTSAVAFSIADLPVLFVYVAPAIFVSRFITSNSTISIWGWLFVFSLNLLSVVTWLMAIRTAERYSQPGHRMRLCWHLFFYPSTIIAIALIIGPLLMLLPGLTDLVIGEVGKEILPGLFASLAVLATGLIGLFVVRSAYGIAMGARPNDVQNRAVKQDDRTLLS